jgi:hypothetical protein
MGLHYFILVCVGPMLLLYKEMKSNHEILSSVKVCHILTTYSLIKVTYSYTQCNISAAG